MHGLGNGLRGLVSNLFWLAPNLMSTNLDGQLPNFCIIKCQCSAPFPACCPQLLSALAVAYTLEPLFTRVYMFNVLTAAEKVLATLR